MINSGIRKEGDSEGWRSGESAEVVGEQGVGGDKVIQMDQENEV